MTDIDRMVFYRRTDDLDLVPLDSPTTAIGANATSIATGISIGFTFSFDDVDYTTIDLCARGFARLAGTEAGSDNTRLYISDTGVILAPWWDDIETAVTVGYVKHEVQGTAPWRRFVVEWYCNLHSSYDGTDYVRAKFQLVLYETTNRIDYRYGTRSSGGSPANTGTASTGYKGDTSGVTDNYRDIGTPSGTPVDNLRLGGSKSTTTSNLRHYAEWPTWTAVAEPAWPMCGRYVEASAEDLVAVQDGYLDPYWIIANNVNWAYCRFTPALVNFSPYVKSSTTFNDPIHVVPIKPSADDLTYRVWIETYSGSGGDLVVDVDVDNAADPQPATGGDWSNVTTETEVGTSIGYHSWAPFDITIDSGDEFLRFKFTDNDLKVCSIMVAPVPLDDVAPLDIFGALNTYTSGFVPMCIAQFRQRAAAVHPEFLNRAWRNMARIARDRWQALWTFGHSNDATEYSFTSSASLIVRRLGIAPCSLRGWRGEAVEYVTYAYDGTDNGELRFTERGGRPSVTIDVDKNGDEYRVSSGAMTLVSDEPVVTLDGDPASALHVMFAGLRWRTNLDPTEDLITEATPPPRLEYLYAVLNRIRRVAIHGYAMTGLATQLRRGSAEWVCAWMVPPACNALRVKLARHNGDGKTTQTASVYGDTSGSGASDEILIPSPFDRGSDGYPPDTGEVAIVSGSEVYDATPAAAMDRLLESPTLDDATAPARERVEVTWGVGITLAAIQPPTVAD